MTAFGRKYRRYAEVVSDRGTNTFSNYNYDEIITYLYFQSINISFKKLHFFLSCFFVVEPKEGIGADLHTHRMITCDDQEVEEEVMTQDGVFLTNVDMVLTFFFNILKILIFTI